MRTHSEEIFKQLPEEVQQHMSAELSEIADGGGGLVVPGRNVVDGQRGMGSKLWVLEIPR